MTIEFVKGKDRGKWSVIVTMILGDERKERSIHQDIKVQGSRTQPCMRKCHLMNKVGQIKYLTAQDPYSGFIIFPLFILTKMGLSD